LLVDHAAKHGRIEVIDVQTADGSTTIGAAAVWLEHPVPEPEDYADRMAAACGEWTDRFEHFEVAMVNAHPIDEAHAYLTLLAIDDRWQSQGLGTVLLEARHAQLHTPAYLEASNSQSRKLYERLGYADCAAPLDLPYNGERIYPMWRKPNA
ncbi:GNAT family N-acetyltransferase, partial [Dactylosporangium siamense]